MTSSENIYASFNQNLAVGLSGITAGCFVGSAIHAATDILYRDARLHELTSYPNVTTPLGIGCLSLLLAINALTLSEIDKS